MKAFFIHLKWQLLILAKNNLVTISIVVTALYAMIFYFIRDIPGSEKFLVLLIYNDPAIIGMFFVGLSVIMEKNNDVLSALFVTPINYHTYLLSKVVALSLIGWACASGMAGSMLGNNLSWVEFSIGVFGTCVIFSFAGIFIVSYTTEFLVFMLKSIPVLLLLSLPLINYFGLTNIQFFNLTPIYGALTLIISSQEAISTGPVRAYVSLLVWIPVLYYIVYKTFVRRIILNDE